MTEEVILAPTSDQTTSFGETTEVSLVRSGLALSNSIGFVPYDRDGMLLAPIFQLHRPRNLSVGFSSVNGACSGST